MNKRHAGAIDRSGINQLPASSDLPKVLVLAPVHRPFGNRVIREAETLVQYGYTVRALMNTTERSERNGVEILPAPKYRTRLGRFAKIPLVYLRARRSGSDFFHAHNPDMLPVAFMLAISGRTVFYDTHEDFSRRLRARDWIPRFLKQPLAKLIVFAERKMSQLAAQTFVTQPHLVDRYGGRALLLRNAPKINPEHLSDVGRRSAEIPDPKCSQIAYIGSISRNRGLFTYLDALVQCNRSNPVRMWLAGQEMANVLDEAKEHPGWQFVDYLGLLPHEDALAYAQKADLCLAVLDDVGDHRDARPTKLTEYMSVGTPFVASNFEEWRAIIDKEEIGIWIEPGNSHTLAQAILRGLHDRHWLEEQSQLGLEFVRSFNWENESAVLVEAYSRQISE